MSKSKKAKVTLIKASLAFVKAAPGDLYTFASSVHSGMNGNTAYPNPPVDMPTFKTAIDVYDTLVTAALDGSKKVLTQRDHQGGVLIRILRQLAHYVEGACKDDMTTFTSSGFQPVSKARTAAKPLSQSIRKITEGPNSGVLLVWLLAVAGALSYELRWAPVATGSATTAAPAWISSLIPSTHPPATVSNLTPGTIYQFEVRVMSKKGWSDWSGAATRMAI
jgi:Fibronectin type III domain